MKKINNFYFIIAILVLLFSCNQSQSGIEKASKMIEHAEQNKDSFTQSEFDKMELKKIWKQIEKITQMNK